MQIQVTDTTITAVYIIKRFMRGLQDPFWRKGTQNGGAEWNWQLRMFQQDRQETRHP